MVGLVDVVEVQIKAPHERRVMERGLSTRDADAYIKFAVFRLGVEKAFYATQPAALCEHGHVNCSTCDAV